MEPNAWNALGHSNRIFSLKYYDENTLISGGWDSNVLYLFRFLFGMLEPKKVWEIYMVQVFRVIQ